MRVLMGVLAALLGAVAGAAIGLALAFALVFGDEGDALTLFAAGLFFGFAFSLAGAVAAGGESLSHADAGPQRMARDRVEVRSRERLRGGATYMDYGNTLAGEGRIIEPGFTATIRGAQASGAVEDAGVCTGKTVTWRARRPR